MTNPIEELRDSCGDGNKYTKAILYLAEEVGRIKNEDLRCPPIHPDDCWTLEKRVERAEKLKNEFGYCEKCKNSHRIYGEHWFDIIDQAFGLTEEPQEEPPKDELVEALERITTDFVLAAIPDKTPLGITDFYNCKKGIAQAIASELRKDPNRWFEAKQVWETKEWKVRAK